MVDRIFGTMKYQQVSVDFVNMVYTACTYLMLAGAAWIFLRLLQACFWLPRHLRKQTDIQQMLQDKVESYEKYILECEEKERIAAEMEVDNIDESKDNDNFEKSKPVLVDEEKWRERRECLEMLKKELKRVRDGGDLHNWDYSLEEDEDEIEEKEGNDDGKKGVYDEKVEKLSEYAIGDTEYCNSNTERSHLEKELHSEAKKDK